MRSGGVPYRKLFLSRWSALLWAGGILWTAVDVADWAAPAPAETRAAAATPASTGDAKVDADLARLANAMSDT